MPNKFIFSPETIIKAYSVGVFPMAQSRDDPELRFYEPAIRGIIPINPPHIPRRLIRFARQSRWQVRFDSAFADVVRHCAEMRADNTWINAEIETLYFALHKMGFGHSVEIWDHDRLIGGLYGLSLGSAFFGESMFSEESNASKMALAFLMAALHKAKFTLLDAQFSSEHLRQFGLIDASARIQTGPSFSTKPAFGHASSSKPARNISSFTAAKKRYIINGMLKP